MDNDQLIPLELFCTYYNVEVSFISALTEFGLIEITTVEQTQFIYKETISDLERLIRMHYELEINIEGIEAIAHLLQRVNSLQSELMSVKNRLNLYEGKDDK